MEYNGWLVAEKYSHTHKTEYVCLDRTPTPYRYGSSGDQNGALMYTAEVITVATEGPSYQNYSANRMREIGCAVCSFPQTTTFINYGRKNCSGTRGLVGNVYSGFVGGSDYRHSGNGMNYLCMPNEMQSVGSAANAGYTGDGSKIVATRYERRTNPINAAHSAANAKVVACSVCEVEYQETMMKPAVQECPSGWEKIYQGYIMAAWYNDNSETESVCVHEDIQHLGAYRRLPGTNNNWYGKMFRTETESPIGTGHTQNWEVTCAMCGRR